MSDKSNVVKIEITAKPYPIGGPIPTVGEFERYNKAYAVVFSAEQAYSAGMTCDPEIILLCISVPRCAWASSGVEAQRFFEENET